MRSEGVINYDEASDAKSGLGPSSPSLPSEALRQKSSFSDYSRQSSGPFNIRRSGMLLTNASMASTAGEGPLNMIIEAINRAKLLCSGCVSFCCFAAANLLLPVIFGVQMLLLDSMLVNYSDRFDWRVGCYCIIGIEVLLVVHMMCNIKSSSAVISGSLQWISYSWLISVKSGLLYFFVLRTGRVKAFGMSFGLQSAIFFLYITPVYYTILTFRTLRQLFVLPSETRGRDGERVRGRGRRGQGPQLEHMTLDVVLLQDMVWHVAIDMIDLNNVMFMAYPQHTGEGFVDPAVVRHFPEDVESLRITCGILVCLALFFHQQSFPSIGYVTMGMGMAAERNKHPAGPPADKTRRRTGSNSYAPKPTTIGKAIESSDSDDDEVLTSPKSDGGSPRRGLSSASVASGSTTAETTEKLAAMPGQTRQPQARKRQMEYDFDVVKARKRSAIISILFVDLPFFAIRTYMASLSFSTRSKASMVGELVVLANATATSAVPLAFQDIAAHTQLDKWWVKNILCLLLQAMQLRFVQQADLERSQRLQWWDTQRSWDKRQGNDRGLDWGGRATPASRQKGGPGRRPSPILGKIFQEMQENERREENKLAAAYEDSRYEETGVMTSADAGDPFRTGTSPVAMDQPTRQTSPTEASPLDRERLSASGSPRSLRPKRPRRRCCRCISCDCSHGVILHALMGLALGWLIAKVDFARSFNDLMLGLGYGVEN